MTPTFTTLIGGAWILGLLAGAGCAQSLRGTRPGDMSATRHRAMAERERIKASRHRKEYDPKLRATRGGVAVAGPPAAMGGFGQEWLPKEIYNPTKSHLKEARVHREHARQHEQAAAALEAFEAKTCGWLPKGIRVACPLLSQASRVERIPGGARVHLRAGVRRRTVLGRMRCHHAYARTQGFQGMNGCPLYLPGIRIAPAPGSDAVDLTGANPQEMREIRHRLRGHVSKRRH